MRTCILTYEMSYILLDYVFLVCEIINTTETSIYTLAIS